MTITCSIFRVRDGSRQEKPIPYGFRSYPHGMSRLVLHYAVMFHDVSEVVSSEGALFLAIRAKIMGGVLSIFEQYLYI